VHSMTGGGGTKSGAIRRDGTVRGWGSGLYGQLGNGTTADSNTAVPVSP